MNRYTKPLALIRKICVLLWVTIASLAINTPPAAAQMMHHFSMPLDQVLQGQANAGTYTPERREAEIKLTDALYERDPTRALALLQESANLDRTFDKPLMYICDRNRAMANPLAAVSACQEAENRLPNFAFYEIRLAEVQELANLPAAAIASYERAAEIDQSNATFDRAADEQANAARLRQAFQISTLPPNQVR